MISIIYSTSPSVQVSGGISSTYINEYNGAHGVGNMRFNTSSQKIEVFDGSNWIVMNTGSFSVGLTSEVESVIQWAKQKRSEEDEREQFAKTNPVIRDLLNKIKDKEEQIKMVMTLIKSPGHDEIKPSMVPLWNK
jgi:hypothetical protein